MPRSTKRSRTGKQSALKRRTHSPPLSYNCSHQVTGSISQCNECLQLLVSKFEEQFQQSSEEDKEKGEEQEEPGFGYRKRSSTCEG